MVAPRILWRYILRDVALHTLIGLVFVAVVIVAQNLLSRLQELIASGVSALTVLSLMGILMPAYLSYVIPTALLFGVLVSFGRMSADGEVVAMRASGVSVPRLLPPVLALGLVGALVSWTLMFEIEPNSRSRLKMIVRELTHALDVVDVGKFLAVGGRTIYVAEEGPEDCPFRGVVIGDLSDAPRPLYITARCAALNPEGDSDLALELTDGSIHLSDSARNRYRKVSFERMHLGLDVANLLQRGRRPRDHTMRELIELRRRAQAGEEIELRGARDGPRSIDVQIHRRVAFPFACVLLSVLAVPLGIRPLRQGRSAGAITAVGAMALYWCLFTVGELTAENGFLPAWLGLWLPNVVVAVLGIWLLRRTIRGDS